MSLPSSIQNQIDEAEKMLNEVSNAQEGANTQDEGLTDEQGQEPENKEPENKEPENKEPENKEPENKEPENVDSVKLAQEWEQKYKTLEGKYRAEVPRLATDNNKLKARIIQLEAKMEELNKVPEPPTDKAKKFDLAAIEEEMGKDFVINLKGLVEDMVEEGVKKGTNSEREKLKPLVDKVVTLESDLTARRVSEFERELAKAVPDWKTLNSDESFIVWLEATEEPSGLTEQTYMDLLSNAHKKGQVDKVAKIFNTYKQAVGKGNDLSDLIEPDSSAGVTPPPREKVVLKLTPEKIEKFYMEVARGAYKGRDVERQKMEKAIDDYTSSLAIP